MIYPFLDNGELRCWVDAAFAHLEKCDICPLRWGVNRTRGELGVWGVAHNLGQAAGNLMSGSVVGIVRILECSPLTAYGLVFIFVGADRIRGLFDFHHHISLLVIFICNDSACGGIGVCGVAAKPPHRTPHPSEQLLIIMFAGEALADVTDRD